MIPPRRAWTESAEPQRPLKKRQRDLERLLSLDPQRNLPAALARTDATVAARAEEGREPDHGVLHGAPDRHPWRSHEAIFTFGGKMPGWETEVCVRFPVAGELTTP